MDQYFDTLYIYILTHKQEKYPDEKIKKLLHSGFNFSAQDHILDKDNFLKRIHEIIETPKLEHLAKLFEHEFSDAQILSRKITYEKGYLNTEYEDLYPNLLPISFPNKFYTAEIFIDEQFITQAINNYLTKAGRRPVKKIKKRRLITHALKNIQSSVNDWIVHENSIYTFRNLTDTKEPLRHIIDVGTITSNNSKHFYANDEDHIISQHYIIKQQAPRGLLLEKILQKRHVMLE